MHQSGHLTSTYPIKDKLFENTDISSTSWKLAFFTFWRTRIEMHMITSDGVKNLMNFLKRQFLAPAKLDTGYINSFQRFFWFS